jgi:hypothetical protein
MMNSEVESQQTIPVGLIVASPEFSAASWNLDSRPGGSCRFPAAALPEQLTKVAKAI